MERIRQVVPVSRFVAVVPAAILIAVGLFHSVRAASAHILYHSAKYGAGARDAKQALALCARSHALYKNNYHICLFAANTAYSASLNAAGAEAGRLRAESEKWSGVGLGINRYNRDLNLAMLSVLCADKNRRGEAVVFWEKYTDWHYWDPFNQLVLLKMYAWSGRFNDAMNKAILLKGTVSEAEASAVVANARSRGSAATGRTGE